MEEILVNRGQFVRKYLVQLIQYFGISLHEVSFVPGIGGMQNAGTRFVASSPSMRDGFATLSRSHLESPVPSRLKIILSFAI
jgi:hypothetical protein